jgi:signal transduction histidine kinase
MISITIISIIISNKISNSFKLYRRNDIEQKDKLLNLNKNLEQKIQIRIHEAQIKDRAMLHQSRLARLGTMISMIAHQWRQPLTELSMILAELETATEFDKINKNMIFDSIHDSNKLLSYMSNTIDDFRMYFKPDKEKVKFSLQKVCNDAISLMKGTFKELDINLEKNFETDAIVEGYPREFSQVILNLLMNAKDMFLDRNIKNARIEFLISKRGKETYIIVRDNAGGVDPENLDKVFEPYFSTKKSNDNTGLGLFMSKMIIEKNMDGRLSVFNVPNGAEFNIVVLG